MSEVTIIQTANFHPALRQNSIIWDDESNSNREKDANQYLHVENCVITAEQVNQYRGKEIKGWEQLGLDPEKFYGVFRPAAEIEKAIETYKNVPLTDDHVILTPENPRRERVLGWSGSNMQMDNDGQLLGDIHVWVGKGIDDIEAADNDPNKGKKELSAGYGYDLVQEEGSYKGKEYQFKMTNLKANHIALVKKGRVEGAQIADSAGEATWKAMGMNRIANKLARDRAKQLLDVIIDADYEGEEDDRIDAILQAATELAAIQEREEVNTATDSGDNVFLKEGNVMKKSGMRILLDHFFKDAEEKEEKDCSKDKKARDNMSILKTMKDVAMKDAAEFEGGEKEKGKTLMDLAASLKDEEEKERMPEEKVEESKDKKAKDKKAKDSEEEKKVLKINEETVKQNEKAAKDSEEEKAEDEEEEKAEDESEEEEKRDGQAKDSMAFDALVMQKVQETIKVRNKVASLCQKVVGRFSESMLLDSDPESMIDYTLTQKGQSTTGKSLEVKVAMVEMLANSAKPAMHIAMDSQSAKNVKHVNLFNVMKGK